MSLFEQLNELMGPNHVARTVTVGGKETTVYFRQLTADAAEEFFAQVDKDPKKNKGLRNKIIAKVVCDENGADSISEKEAGKLPNQVANELQKVALDVNGLSAKAQEEAKNA
jgi:hypothetical protein